MIDKFIPWYSWSRTIGRGGFVGSVIHVFTTSGLPPASKAVELTETNNSVLEWQTTRVVGTG
jgi:hypothetical protein